jgi:N-acyl-D-aspartate/D-glutamate deacylase
MNTPRETILEESIQALQAQVKVLREQLEGQRAKVTAWHQSHEAICYEADELESERDVALHEVSRLEGQLVRFDAMQAEAAKHATALDLAETERDYWKRRFEEAELLDRPIPFIPVGLAG